MKLIAPSLWKNDAALGGSCASLPPNLRAECELKETMGLMRPPTLKSSTSTEVKSRPFLNLLGVSLLALLLIASIPLAVSLFETKSKK